MNRRRGLRLAPAGGAKRGLATAALALATGVAVLGVFTPLRAAAAATTVVLEEMTSPQLRERIAAGATTVLVPIGGTEQNGPHMVLGKHNARVRALALRIAEQLGNAVVAPVLAYVPEGEVDLPTQHMRWAGTISVGEPAFEATLEGAARSLRRHGFVDIVLLGDHGGYQKSLQRAADRLNRFFAASARGRPVARVHALPEYYRASQFEYVSLLEQRGHSAAEIGTHAGLADTSLALAIDPALVHLEALASRPTGSLEGVTGDPRRASAELGRLGVERVVLASVSAIRARAVGPAAASPSKRTLSGPR